MKKTKEYNKSRSTAKEVRDVIRQHIVELTDDGENQRDPLDILADNVEAAKDYKTITAYHAGRKLVENGEFLIYNDEIIEFLENWMNLLNLENNIKRYGAMGYYAHLIGREVNYLLSPSNRYKYITIHGALYHINDVYGDYCGEPITVKELLSQYENRDVIDTDICDYAGFIDFLDNIFGLRGGR
jgi:hypothetical protein